MPKREVGGGGGQARAQSLRVSFSLWALAAAGILRVGWLDHNWLLAGAIVVAAVVAMPTAVRLLKSRDREALQQSPVGTLFVAGANVVGSQLRREAGFAQAVSDWHRGWMTGGYIGGTLRISNSEIAFTPGPWSGRGVSPVVVPLAEVVEISALKLPAKINVASLVIRLAEGSQIAVQVRGFDRLQGVLQQLRAQHRLPVANTEPSGI